MMQPVYIRSASVISAQDSFNTNSLPEELKNYADGKLFVIDPNYRDYINPVAIRRMSRLLKAGISAGMQALKNAELEQPDGIITGTGRGNMTDMEIFTKDIIKLEEQALNPTYFIQSTYNSINGWLALQTKCTGYNQTYVHRGNSLALALLDAQMLLNETNEHQTYLVGGFDELTDEYVVVKHKINYWKKEEINSLELHQHNNTPGTIAGEGSAFFTMTNQKENAQAKLKGIKALETTDPETIQRAISEILTEHDLNKDDIDVMYCGMNGDRRHQPLYDAITEELSANTSIAAFKHLCGEYETSSGFAIWLAMQTFQQQLLHPATIIKEGQSKNITHTLIVNHYLQSNTSIILLSQP